MRKLGASQNDNYAVCEPYLETRPAATVANIIICLIHQANCLLDQRLRHLERAFLAEGRIRERMIRARRSRFS